MTAAIVGGTAVGRSRLRKGLESGGIVVTVSTDDATAAVEAIERLAPSVCLVAGDGQSSLSLTRLVAGTASPPRIAVVSDSPDEDQLLALVRAGAHGQLSSDISHERLSAAILALADGEALIPRWMTTRVVTEFQRRGPIRVYAPPPRRSPLIVYALLYVPRFVRHFQRRLRARMSLRSAYRSSRSRVRDYR